MAPTPPQHDLRTPPTQASDSATTDEQALIEEARRRQRRRRRLIAGIVVLVALVAIGFGLWRSRSPNATAPPPQRVDHSAPSSRPLPLRNTSVSTAYVVDAAGLVPVDLVNDHVGATVKVAGFSFSGSSSNVAVSPDGTTAYVVAAPSPAQPGTLLRGPAVVSINLVSRRVSGRIPFRATAVEPGQSGPGPSFYVDGLALTPNGRTLLVADAGDDELIPVDLDTRTIGRPIRLPKELPQDSLISTILGPVYRPRLPAPITDLAVSPNGETAYVVEGYVVVPVDLSHGRAERPITGFDGPEHIAISPDGTTAYVTNPYCWEVLSTGQCESPPKKAVREPNGHVQLAAVGEHVSVVDLVHRRISGNIDVGRGAEPEDVAVSPDGSTLYLTYGKYGTKGRFVGVVDASTRKTLASIDEGLASVDQGAGLIALTPNGQEAMTSAFEVITPGPEGPVVFRGVVPINLRTRRAGRPIGFGSPVTYGLSTGRVVFGQ
jgi:DNA-binding beta-propeller fold protein YncE